MKYNGGMIIWINMNSLSDDERRFYQKVTDIYATSIDYDPKSPTSIDFFKRVQNKMHFEICF